MLVFCETSRVKMLELSFGSASEIRQSWLSAVRYVNNSSKKHFDTPYLDGKIKNTRKIQNV